MSTKSETMGKKFLLICGVLASLLYIAMNIITPFLYEGYNWVSQTVSELSAVDAPTRLFWVVPGVAYTLLIVAFGVGVIKSAGQKKSLRIAGAIILFSGLIGLTWSPMHQREVLAAGGGTFTDTWHIAMSVITVLCMFLTISFSAAAFGKSFRFFSIATLIVFVVFGVLTGMEAPQINKNGPTPFIGLWERINIAAFMLWLIVFSSVLLRYQKKTYVNRSKNAIAETKIYSKQRSEIKETVH